MSRPSFDFVLSFEPQGDRYVVRGEMGRHMIYGSPFSRAELEAALARTAPGVARLLDPNLPERPADLSQVTQLGRSLYETALGGTGKDWFERFHKEMERRGPGLRINLDFSRTPELASLPWEYLYSPKMGFLSLSLHYPLRRYVATYRSARELPIGRSPYLRVLEVGRVGAPPGRSSWHYEIRHDRLDQVTPEELYREVRMGAYDVLHFGHSALDSLRLDGVEIGRLGEILTTNPPRLTVLDGLGTAGSKAWLSGSAPWAAAAEGLVRQGLPAVVSIPAEMTEPAALRFGESFYARMAAGDPVDAAVAEARLAVHSAGGPEGTTWGLPTLYTSTNSTTPELTRSASVEFRGLPDRAFSWPAEAIKRDKGVYGVDAGPDVPDRQAPPPDRGLGTEGPPPPPPQRYLLGSFPVSVRLGDHVALQVRIALERGNADERSTALRELLVPPEGLNALLVLNSPGFEALGGNSRNVRIPQTRDSDPVAFELKAVREGVQNLDVSAYAGGYLGTLRIEATVDSAATTGESREHRQSVRNRPRQDGDMVLEVRYDESAKVYRFNWIDDLLIPVGELAQRLKQTPQQAIESLIGSLNEQAGGITSHTARQTQRKLRNEGIRLWRELIPVDLQRQFWTHRDRIKRLFIISEGDPVPWELLYPFEPGTSNDAGFLAEQFPISRWLRPPGGGPSASLRVSNAAFVGPDDSLPHARHEIETIRGIVAGRGARAQEPIQRLNPLLDLLDESKFDLLHFACHNQFKTERIMMGDQAFEPVFLEEHEDRFKELAPLVFLNACHSDSHLPQYTQLGGWAHSFLRAGAGAFLGTLWQVRDETASAFAEAFYRALKPGTRLGDALQQARMEARNVAGDPTWLAYALYGDSLAALE